MCAHVLVALVIAVSVDPAALATQGPVHAPSSLEALSKKALEVNRTY